MAGTITPCLLFAGEAEDAARFYTGIFDDSAITSVSHYAENMPMPAGTVLLVEFTLRGRPMQALNGGPNVAHTEAMSLSVDCADQAEIDRIWDALLAGGGSPSMCGWLKDRFGVSWQVVPAAMSALEQKATPAQFQRMMAAMMSMVKLDISALEAAFAGA
jgi:predicted 3-demethylubiquinone-9 3-methyltransferase (glyoxalase superfamily)